MYWKMAVSACRRVSHVLRQISSALMVLKKVSTAALMFLCSSSGNRRRLWPAEGGEYLSYDASLDAAHDFSPRLAFCRSPSGLDFRFMAVAHGHDGDTVEGGIGLPVAVAVQAHSVRLAT